MPTKAYVRRPLRELIAAILAFLWVTGCAILTGIPNLDTPDGRIYAQRCGACHGRSYVGSHGIPDPRFRTMAEWENILPKMEQLIRERELVPLGESEREAIIRYLNQHAKS